MPEPRRNSQRDLAVRLIRRDGMMRLSELMRHGVNSATLSRLVAEGLIRRPARGLYELADADVAAAHAFATVAKRVPRGAICLISALQFHGLTLQVPRQVWLAIGSKDRKPAIDYPPVRTFHFGEKALTLGVESHTIDAVPVPIFDPAKSIVDCFRFRNAVGLDVALEALRLGWRSRKARPDDLATYARALRVWSVLRPYLESVVADDG